MEVSSDTIINPGYVGLSVNQGLCLGVPTITRSGLPHSPEIDFIKEARTGFISNDHKVMSFVQPIKTVIQNREKFYKDSVSFAENNPKWHHKNNLGKKDLEELYNSIGGSAQI